MIGNRGFKIKSPAELEIMAESGKRLAKVKNELRKQIKVGQNAKFIDDLAEELIGKEGGKPSFKMVKDYYWTTCVNLNEGIVHGIPHKSIVFKKGDVVSVDVGIYYEGFHTDTSFSVGLSLDAEKKKFLEVGELALNKAIKKARPGARIYDISETIETTLEASGYTPVKVLVGHGVGRELHEDPQIPCFVSGRREDTLEIPVGAAIAIEVMYALGDGNLYIDEDGWTIKAADGKITGLFEDTVLVRGDGPLVVTR